MNLLERISRGDLEALQSAREEGQLETLLYAIPDCISLSHIEKFVDVDEHPVWLCKRGIQVEQSTGDISAALEHFERAQSIPAAKSLHERYALYREVVRFMGGGDVARRMTFQKMDFEVSRMDDDYRMNLLIHLAVGGRVYKRLFDSVLCNDWVAPNSSIDSDIFSF